MEILRDDEEQELKYKRTGRLDMSHGFLHHIRRNQIARDDYDKQVKQANEHQRPRHTTTSRLPRRPDIQVYHPRRGNGSQPGVGAETEEWNESGSSTEPETHGTELFWLDYQADSGHVTSYIVLKEDKPERVVERVAEENVLDSTMRMALQARLRKEMDKRRNKR
ncbi:UPF0561 protein C2orf68 homolog [Oncorhynchus nerka]|nr:UPF0561 protein C2orf68 homolog [Oncorhynchus mykiss]XP_029534029.1 UPF0561 protein C2orf68 homolog [Oncorhynchus nerka]XP_035592039.1 UPF0561 protein C2orf68 homolog [Oncorhynchus keta]XP_036791829.1 UPF0561 protein C2orf68 homolog [Oncorhynchus mykiss]XP_046206778.1 UPF0561 protein C2orf68 homolog [Oncorhynchus gorbuscha]